MIHRSGATSSFIAAAAETNFTSSVVVLSSTICTPLGAALSASSKNSFGNRLAYCFN
jgi:hypothetical protein